ncbi:hypothetical protein SAOR_08890 [Salinisphaera orenii MK-B5]|uniref:Uncharacterized protein n=1 Tax=Salinisphaera orenii MK-B5 TaxID=856730 RepID=A0A423PNY0_9GAMM|nr:hypothetical protein [Salinisphaera orenii]ROO27268.1 hypothetical protein SAOR_08890 [Salinisphaera orenii MK-B5]
MKNVLLFAFWFLVGLIALFLAIVLGDSGAWYLAWVLGTVMMILIAVTGTVILEVDDQHND